MYVGTAIGQMDAVTQQNAAMVEQATAATHGLRVQCDRLIELTGRFELKATTDERVSPSARMPAYHRRRA